VARRNRWRVQIIALASILVLVGCQDTTRVADLEKRVSNLEQNVHQLEADRTKSADEESAKRTQLENCVTEADAQFDTSMMHNGTKQRNGSFDVPMLAMEQMQRQKQGKIEECKLRYSK